MKNSVIKIRLNGIDDVKKLIKITSKYTSDIDIISGRNVIDAKSFLGVSAIDLSSQDIRIRIISDDITECRKFECDMEEFR